MITEKAGVFWACFFCTDARLPFINGGFILSKEAWDKIEAQKDPLLIYAMGKDRYLVIVERTGRKYKRNLYEIPNGNTVIRDGLRLHLTGLVHDGEMYGVFEAETVEKLAWQLERHKDWILARKEYLSRPTLGDWLRELGVSE